MTLIKFCGITNYEDAKLALDLGVDALGFNFCRASSRYIDVNDAKTIVRRLPASIWLAGVFVNSNRAEIDETSRMVGLNTVQLHGEESPAFCSSWDQLRVVKALRIGMGGAGIEDCEKYLTASDFLLLDYYSPMEYGGTGKEIDEVLLSTFPRDILNKSLLSGGLTPENVKAKLDKFLPYGVDVASGIEAGAGKKSLAKMSDFIEAIRG